MKKYFPFIILLLAFIINGCRGPFNQIDELQLSDEPELKSTEQISLKLSGEEEEDLLFMREEEKLAHDVYFKLYEKYKHQIFQKICLSEQNHADQILKLIDKYELVDPALPEIGKFSDSDLQELYDKLMAIGNKDLVSALGVGVEIEEKDMIDIVAAMERTDKKDILNVYANLLDGSKNHLDAFQEVLLKVE